MTWLGAGAGTPRPDVNEMSSKEALREQEERVHEQMLRDEVDPSWLKQLTTWFHRRHRDAD